MLDEEARRAFGEFDWAKTNLSDRNMGKAKVSIANKNPSPPKKDATADELLEPTLCKKVKKGETSAETANAVDDGDKENDPGIHTNQVTQEKVASRKTPFGISDIENLPKKEAKPLSPEFFGSLGDLMANSKKRLSRLELEKQKFKEEQEEKRKKELQSIKDRQIIVKLDLSS